MQQDTDQQGDPIIGRDERAQSQQGQPVEQATGQTGGDAHAGEAADNLAFSTGPDQGGQDTGQSFGGGQGGVSGAGGGGYGDQGGYGQGGDGATGSQGGQGGGTGGDVQFESDIDADDQR